MKDGELKVIKKSPEKIENRLAKESEHINKQIEALKNKDAEPDYYAHFSEELTKLKNPIQIWVRGNIFDNLGMNDIACLYQCKSEELGYCIDENMNESLSLKTTFTTDAEIDQFSKLLKSQNIDYKWSAELGTLILNNEEDVKKVQEYLPPVSENNNSVGTLPGEIGADGKPIPAICNPFRVPETTTTTTTTTTENVDAPTKLRAIKVKYNDGTEKVSNMAAHLTDQEMLDYFAPGKVFNLGNGENDHMVKVESREIVEGMTNENKWAGKMHSYKSTNGHTCLMALDEETSKKLEEFFVNFQGTVANEAKEVFQIAPDAINGGIRDIYAELEKDVKKPEYDAVALNYLINGDNFLKFAYHNMSTGELSKDLDMMFKQYVKDEEPYMKQLKALEGYVIRENVSLVDKFLVATDILDFMKKNEANVVPEQVSDLEFSDVLYKISKDVEAKRIELKEYFDLLTGDVKEAIKTSLNEQYADVLAKTILSGVESFKDTSIFENIKKASNFNDVTNTWIVKCFNESVNIVLPHVWIGGKQATAITGIITGLFARTII